MASKRQPSTGITAAEAIGAALRAAHSNAWYLGFVSNTGVTCTILSETLAHGHDALMKPDGEAGQWVIEFFKHPPAPGWPEGNRRWWYRFRTVVVTSTGATTLPDAEFHLNDALSPLDLVLVGWLDRARERALHHVHAEFDLMSVKSTPQGMGAFLWEFDFYKLHRRDRSMSQEIVGHVTVRGDGSAVVA